jgi:glycosyltransferase involved in cell wall biosynthesis
VPERSGSSRLRLAVVTPRFWPLAGEAESHLLRLAERWMAAGVDVTVVTAVWQPHWPRNIVVREIPVTRLAGAPHGGFGTLRYMYALTRWLSGQRDALDVVLVSTLRHEAYCAVRSLAGSRVPVILQAERAGPAGDVAWQRTAPFGGRIASRCRQATAFVATSRLAAGELAGAGYVAERTTTIPRGVPIPPPLGAATRDAARESLASANHDFACATQHPVALAVGRFLPETGLVHLVKAWATVAARFPQARLWIVGDGPQRDLLYQLIGDLDLRQRVLLPGTFAQTQELFAAADLFVQPAVSEVPTLAMLEGMAAGLPAIASDLPGNREWIANGETGVLVPPADPRALVCAILDLLDRPAERVALGNAARASMRQSHGLEACAQAYLELIKHYT